MRATSALLKNVLKIFSFVISPVFASSTSKNRNSWNGARKKALSAGRRPFYVNVYVNVYTFMRLKEG